MLKKVAELALSVASFMLSPLFALIARTGYGSDVCWRFGFLPLPVHYYSPVPDSAKLKRLNWQKAHDMPGIRLDLDKQIELVLKLGRQYSSECVWPDRLHSGTQGYYSTNPSFGLSSACLLHSFVRAEKPSRVIEIGSGYSTLIIAGALQSNLKETGKESEFMTIDPYPPQVLRRKIPGLTRSVRQCVEDVPAAEFESLGGGTFCS